MKSVGLILFPVCFVSLAFSSSKEKHEISKRLDDLYKCFTKCDDETHEDKRYCERYKDWHALGYCRGQADQQKVNCEAKCIIDWDATMLNQIIYDLLHTKKH